MAEDRVIYMVVGVGVSAEDRHFLPPDIHKVFVLDGMQARDVEGAIRALGLGSTTRIATSLAIFPDLPHQSVVFGCRSHLVVLTAAAVNWIMRTGRVHTREGNIIGLSSVDPENLQRTKMAAMSPEYTSGICSVRVVNGQVASVWPVTSAFPIAS